VNLLETDMAAALPDVVERRPSTLTLLLPWLAAPLFCLLPIGGCAVASSMRQGATETARAVATDPPLVAIMLPR
jgi:hypothetical protein